MHHTRNGGGTSASQSQGNYSNTIAGEESSSGDVSLANDGGSRPPASPEPSVSSDDTLASYVNPFTGMVDARGFSNAPPGVTASPIRNANAGDNSPGRFYRSPSITRSTARGTRGSGVAHSYTAPRSGKGSQQQSLLEIYGPPVKIGPQLARRDSNASHGSSLPFGSPKTTQKQEASANQGSQASPGPRPRQLSNSAAGPFARGPGMLHPALMTHNAMYQIPQESAVQEFAFRRGQQDRGNTRDRVPPNQFGAQYDLVWDTFYKKGKQSNADAIVLAENPPSPSHPNFGWAPLVNVYTQSLEHPRGNYDAEFSRNVCQSALDGMEMLIHRVCRRRDQWDKYVCDVPRPVVEALLNFPDLLGRYENLRRIAHEALGGGLPYAVEQN